MAKEKKYLYSVYITKTEGTDYPFYVEIPDLDGHTQGKDFNDAIAMARDYIGSYCTNALNEGKEPPAGNSKFNKTSKGEIHTLVDWPAEIEKNPKIEFESLSDWIMDEDDYCAMRIYKGGDPEKVEDRVAMIEKTPRVRVARESGSEAYVQVNGDSVHGSRTNVEVWIYGGNHRSSEYGHNEEARQWCDEMLKTLGHE